MKEQESTYVNEINSVSERVRLAEQEGPLNKYITSLQGEVNMAEVREVLDVACGSGGWLIDLVKRYPHVQGVGIDASEGFLEYAKAQAELDDVQVDFQEMSALKPLRFSDNSFDIVNARLILAFMPRAAWLPLLAECKRVLRPGGLLVITEQEVILSNDHQLDMLWKPMYKTLHRAGYTFAESEEVMHLCTAIMLPSLFRNTGFVGVHHNAFNVDFSTGEDAQEPLLNNFVAAFENGGPTMMKLGLIAPEQIEASQAYLNSLRNKPGFIGMWHFISSYGRKP